MSHHSFGRKKTRFGRRIILLIVIVVIWVSIASTQRFSVNKSIVVKKWDTLNVFLAQLDGMEKFRVKTYIKTHEVDLANIQLGTYQFSGSYTPETFLDVIQAWPTSEYVRFTVLEGWSIYDIDASLATKWFIQPGEYVAYVSSKDLINNLWNTYRYLAEAYKNHAFPSLEWWLYPDTYFIDPGKDPLVQLVKLQLQAFDKKIYQPYTSAITSFTSLLQAKGITLSYTMDLWNILRLASVVEKEERNSQNKPTVAWIFFNRLQQWTLLGADITLCYGLHKPYENCTPSFINQHIDDTDNVYNTRVYRGLPPTPIANSSVDTIRAVLEFNKTNYFFYIHDANGVIRYAENIQWHNDNISKYLR